MNAPVSEKTLADATMLDPSGLTRRDPAAKLESMDDTMRKLAALSEQAIADRKRQKSARIAGFQADKKAAKARYEAEIALLDGYIAEEREAADAAIAADKMVGAKAKAALAMQAGE